MGGEATKLGTIRVHIPDVLESIRRTPAFEELDAAKGERLLEELKEVMSRRSPGITEDTLVGCAGSTLAGRISGYLKVYGGNMTVDAACASSLASVAVASEMLLSGRCSCAVVGSVDSDLSIDTFINFCRLKALSSSLSRPFMEGSDGFTMGEGGGVIILKRLDDALRHGDRIYARIAGCGMSSDGETGSMTIPSPLGQRRALQRAFASSGFRPGTVGYVEAHGTGTPIGDAVELEELGEAFAEASPHSIPVGTVKAHIGHLKSAAGMASMIKVVEALQNRTIPPAWIEGDIRDEFNQPTFPFALAPEARPWPRMGTVPRRAAVSAFGFGGSNYHLHLEEFDERQRELSSSRLLLFSGANEDGVRARVSAFSAAVGERGAVDVASVEQIAQLGGRGDCRLAVVWDGESSWDEVESRVQNALRGQSVDGVWFQRRCERKPIAFLFPGQGSVGGASFQQLRDTIPEFAARIADSGDCLDVSFDPLLWPGARSESSGSDWRKDTRLQPATTALSLALGHLLQAVGVTPDAVAGHSLGFYAALVTSGALREHDALTLLRERAACFDAAMQPDTSTMLALRTDADTARRLIDACPVVCHLANVNSPNQTGISLSTQDVPAAVEFFTNAGVESQRLSVICGFHSPFVQAAGARFEKHLQQARFRDPHCVLYSETLGARVPEHAFDAGCPGWFAEHIVKPVRFVELLEAMYDDGYRCFIEVGARGTLSRFARDTLSDVSVVSSPLDTTRDDVVHHWHELLAALYVEQGAPIDYGGYVSLFAAHLWPIATRPGAMLRAPQVDSGVPKSVQDAPSAAEGPGSVSGEADDIFNSVCEILSKFSGFERSIIQPEHEVQGTLGIDSLKTIEIGMEIEKRLGVRLAGTAFSGSLTVQGLAEEIRCAAGGAPLAQADIGRRVLEAVEVSAVPEATGGRGIALVSADRELVESWRAHGYGPAYQISLTGTCVGEALQDALAGRVSRGIVFVGDSSDVERSLLGALTLAQQRFTGEGQGEGEDACRFITASFSEAGRPVDDALCAFSKSLQRDLVHVRCGHVSFCDTIEPAAAASILYAEAIAEQEPYAFVSYCDSRRWVSHCVEASVNPKAGDALLQASDVVLVTGGGRGITAQLILALAASVKPFLILVGSTDLDSESSHADEVRDTLKRLADLGCKTDYVQCDLSRPDTVREMMQSIAKRHPPVTGVIHGAGLLADSNIAEKRASDFADVVGVKSGSARLIEAALDLSALRFWVSMSSIAAFLGNAGQTDYAAASQDLVVQAYRLKALGVATVKAVLWGPWSGMGMVVDQDLEARFAAAGVPLIGVEEGVAFLAEELRHSGDSVVAYSGPLSGFAFTEPLPDDAVWRQRAVVGAQVSLRSRRFESTEAFLADHTIDGVPVLPGVMALELSAQARPSAPYPLCWRDIQLRRLVTSRADGLVLSLCHAPVAPKTVSFSCSELGEADEPSAVGELEWGCAKPSALELGVNEEVLKTFELSALYGSDGLLFSGPRFQVIAEAVQVGDSWARSTLRDSHSAASTAKDLPCRTPAALIDGLLQVAALYCLHHLEAAYLPTAVDELWCCGEAITCASAEVIAVHRDTSDDGQHVRFDASLAVDGEPVVVRGLTMSRVG
ncbi:MAG: SDR family NAD(P)-dependent oxidoreductase [Verrucomicrobia bacterium]|nr:SDR family NAD(P)-dependent oxidoreductase [Verrucomicrobiota bacterium]